MAPEMLLTAEARELRELGAKIRDYQTAKELSDSAMLRKFSGLGSTKTYTRVLSDDLAELDLERQLANYRAVWALIESVGDVSERTEELYEDMTPVAQLRKTLFEVMRETGNARFVLVEGDTGLGKSCARRILIERYGQRILWVEATDVWNDSPGAFLAAVLTALGVREIPQIATDRLNRLLARLTETRVCLIIDELHHLGPRCLNTIKTLINQSPGEIVGLAMPTLWRRLEREAYEEVRQLTGNRLAERIKLALRDADISRFIERRLGAKSPCHRQAVRLLMDRAPRYGNLAFVRDVCARVAELIEGTDGPDLETWTPAINQEVASR